MTKRAPVGEKEYRKACGRWPLSLHCRMVKQSGFLPLQRQGIKAQAGVPYKVFMATWKRNWVVTRVSRPLVGRDFFYYKSGGFTLPIKIADGIEAISELKKEGIVTIGEKRARTQDIRPLKILIL
jgi:hypothetical protein